MEEIKYDEQWKSDGNCKYCKRIKYCSKTCAAAKMRKYRADGILLKLSFVAKEKIRNRTDAMIALKAVDNKADHPHTVEELDALLKRLEKVAVTKKKSIRNLIAAACIQAALNHIDLETIVTWIEKDMENEQ